MVRPETAATRRLIVRETKREGHRLIWLRKGNIVDLDGKLYVVLNAENFHPGKGTPTTQVDMRRISDGVKTQMRYKTTNRSSAPMSRTWNSNISTKTAMACTS